MTDSAAHCPCSPPTPASPATLAHGCLTSVRHSAPLHVLLLPGTLLPGNPVSSLPQVLQVSAQMSPSQGGHPRLFFVNATPFLCVTCFHGAYTTCHCVFGTYCLYYPTPSLESGCLKEMLSGWGAHPCSGLAFQIWSWGPRTTMAAFKSPDPRAAQLWGHRFGLLLRLLLKVTSTELLPLASFSHPGAPW